MCAFLQKHRINELNALGFNLSEETVFDYLHKDEIKLFLVVVFKDFLGLGFRQFLIHFLR